jgi:hypothetical protein
MKKPFRNLSEYQLFFEEIGPKLNISSPYNERPRKQADDYEKAPCINESQINQLREDLRALGGDKESPTT